MQTRQLEKTIKDARCSGSFGMLIQSSKLWVAGWVRTDRQVLTELRELRLLDAHVKRVWDQVHRCSNFKTLSQGASRSWFQAIEFIELWPQVFLSFKFPPNSSSKHLKVTKYLVESDWHRHTPFSQVTEIQEGHGVQLVELTDTTGEISQRVNKVNQARRWGHREGQFRWKEFGSCFSKANVATIRTNRCCMYEHGQTKT